jgi:hypothetical protein
MEIERGARRLAGRKMFGKGVLNLPAPPMSVAPMEPGSRVKGASTPLRALDPFPEVKVGTRIGKQFSHIANRGKKSRSRQLRGRTT